MIEVVDVSPGGRDALEVETTLDGVTIRITLRWLPRITAWVYQVLDADGVALGMQRAVRPGAWIRLDRRDPRVPPGWLTWSRCPEPYERADLGVALQLEYLPASTATT